MLIARDLRHSLDGCSHYTNNCSVTIFYGLYIIRQVRLINERIIFSKKKKKKGSKLVTNFLACSCRFKNWLALTTVVQLNRVNVLSFISDLSNPPIIYTGTVPPDPAANRLHDSRFVH